MDNKINEQRKIDAGWVDKDKSTNTRVTSGSIFKGKIEQDVGGGYPFEKKDTNTRTSGANGQFRVDRGDKTMQPRDENGQFAEVSLVGRVPEYEHPGHEYKGSEYLKEVKEKLQMELINKKTGANMNGRFADMEIEDFRKLLIDNFGIRKGGEAIVDKRYPDSVAGVRSVATGKTQTGTATLIQMRMNGKVGTWSKEFLNHVIENEIANRSHYATTKRGALYEKGKDASYRPIDEETLKAQKYTPSLEKARKSREIAEPVFDRFKKANPNYKFTK